MVENYSPNGHYPPLSVDMCYGADFGLNPFGRKLQHCFVLSEALTTEGITPVRKEDIGKEIDQAVTEVVAIAEEKGLVVRRNGDLSLDEKTAIVQNWRRQWSGVIVERKNLIYQRCKTEK